MRLIISFFLSVLFLQMNAQVTKTYAQNLPVRGSQIEINLDHPFEIIYSSRNYIRVESNITLYNSGNQTLKTLVQEGQFRLKMEKNGAVVLLSDNQKRKKVLVNGTPLKEKISYKIFLPRSMANQQTEEQALIAATR